MLSAFGTSFFLVLACLCTLRYTCGESNIPKLHLITVVNGDNPIYGYPPAAPMYEVAFQNVNALYGDLLNETRRTLVYLPGQYSCSESASLMVTVVSRNVALAMETHADYWPVIFAPGCSLETLALGDFAREWSVPLISALASDQSLRDKGRYPTVVAFPAPDHQSLPPGIQKFLEQYKWRTLTFFCDDSSQYPAVATFYAAAWRNIKRKLDNNLGKYNIYENFFDSKNFSSWDYRSLMLNMKKNSRVAIFYAHPRVLRTFLITAHRLNMTNGDYMFLNSQPTTVPTLGDITWRYLDADDQVAFEAYKSLIFFRNPDPDWAKIPDVVEEYVNMSRSRFHKTFTADQTVLNETRDQIVSMTGPAFIRRFWNRSFTYPSRDCSIGPAGLRVNDVVFYRLNFSSGLMEISWRYYMLRGTLESISNLTSQWKMPEGPPPNEPVCGFLDNLCYARESAVGMIAGTATALVLILVALVSAALYWRNFQKDEAETMWWLLDSGSLHETDYNDPKFPTSLRGERQTCPANFSKVWRLNQEYVILEMVHSEPIKPQVLLRNRSTRNALNTLKRLRHENLAAFSGIIHSKSASTCMVFECGLRGSLRSLLQSEVLHVDAVLQSSLIWDAIAGLTYVHSSALRWHGCISSFNVMLDKRFCAKICGQAAPRFRAALGRPPVYCSGNVEVAVLWAPAEAFLERSFIGTQEGDIFSLGVLICELLTKRTPLGTRFASAQSVAESIHRLQKAPKSVRITITDIPPAIRSAVAPCLDPLPSKRPTLQRLSLSLRPLIEKAKLLESLVERLQRYADDLEEIVAYRTEGLVAAQKKVDDILKEIIPESLVHALRNKIPVRAEIFNQATILFSSIPTFESVSAVCTPLETIGLLNDIYSLYDRTTSRFDVYKLETINDSYIVTSGLPRRNGNRHAVELARMALGMLDAAREVSSPTEQSDRLELRIGIHSGPCAAGMIGVRLPHYCVFGDTMNTASRMESHGTAGRIHVSTTTKSLLDRFGGHPTVSRGMIYIKGKGEMETFWLKRFDATNNA